jgi:hypothetical protein
MTVRRSTDFVSVFFSRPKVLGDYQFSQAASWDFRARSVFVSRRVKTR